MSNLQRTRKRIKVKNQPTDDVGKIGSAMLFVGVVVWVGSALAGLGVIGFCIWAAIKIMEFYGVI